MAPDAAEEEKRSLRAKRGAKKATLTRIKNKMATEPKEQINFQMLKLMEEKATTAFGEYEELCLQLGDDEDIAQIEECFYECVSTIRERIAMSEPSLAKSPIAQNTHSISKIKLPNVEIQPFHGKYTEYRPFIEMFNALVDRNEGFDSVQKFFYLRSFVKDEPFDLIKNLPVIGASYKEALAILSDRYNNKYKTINEHINGLFEMPVMTKSSVPALRTLISDTKQHLAALKNLGESIDKWDSILICLMNKKIDQLTSREYHLHRDNSKQPTFTDFLTFLEGRALALENSEGRGDIGVAATKPASTKVANVVTKAVTCLFCGKPDHKMFECPKFSLASVAERLTFVKNKNLCKICLNSHLGRCKFHFKCSVCKESHNSLLHTNNECPTVSLNNVTSNNQVLLPTAKVKLVTKSGKSIIVKALLDSASQSSFIASKIARELGYPLLPNTTGIIGIANTEKSVRHRLQLDVFSCVYPYKAQANLLVVDNITTKLPQNEIDLSKVNFPKNIKLADDSFHLSSNIDMLLAADIFFQALLPQPEQLLQGDAAQLSLVHTQFGYIVGGNVPASLLERSAAAVTLFCQDCQTNINDTISNFWQTEKVPEIYAEHTSEQQQCENLFTETVKLENNQFTVSLPLKIPIYDVNNTLGDSFGLALKRFYNLEKRLQKDPQLCADYKDFIHEYLDLGHGSYIDICSYDLSKDPVYFLPHHAVVRPDAVSTRLRTVFDASMKTSTKVSLNNILMNGPIVQQELFDILLSLRVHKYFFACDIRRMFRNILVEKEQRSLQNILWRDNPDESVKCIQLNTVTYGMTCSSYLSTRCLKELAIKFESQYPLASSAILNSTYVDDVIHTEPTLVKIVETQTQLTELLAKGSFALHKWAANDPSILANIPIQQQVVGEKELSRDIKTLGLKLDIDSDSFKLSCPKSKHIPTTKRQILSYISQFHDPLGVAGPVFVQAKIIMQKLSNGTDWDSKPPPFLQKEWLQFYNDLQDMKEIQIKRNVTVDNIQSAQLVAFADASIVAYGAAIYLRVIDKHGKITMSLLCSKSRVAPKDNKLSCPRLELNACLLMSKLCLRVYNTLSKKISIESVHLFSDSQVVLAWQKTDPTKLNAYVANRVKLINEYTQGYQWLYIKTDMNPSDCLSRGLKASELQNNQLWWYGPTCMSDPAYKFTDGSYEVPKNLPEVKHARKAQLTCATSHISISLANYMLDKFSNINKATNVLAYIQRFCKNARPGSQKVKLNFISFKEKYQALHFLIKYEQEKFFVKELDALRAGRQVSSYLQSVNPFVDANGILRIGGRLQHSSLPYSQRHQIILPKESRVTCLIIQDEHLKLLHASQKEVLSSLSQRYWIVNGLRLVKKFVNKCLTCFRLKGVTAKQLMGSLPADRVNADRAFAKVGIDFAGPIMIKQSRVRSVITTKGYIAVYVCFVTKAIHLELVSDLTTDTFLASFKRFISRRNVPTEVYCDNAATFKAANTQLSELYKLNNYKCHQMQVQNVTAKLGTTFHFIPSYSPVFGALWEAAVKSVKYHLKRVLCSHVLTYEQLYTVLVQFEGILNSRPITPLSSDTEDLSFLTPGHFLTGAPLTCYPEQDVTNLPTNRIKFWKRCTAIQQHFWRYWSQQYLNVLQNRPKWKTAIPNIKVGALVILREIDTPPMTWPMARVTKTFPGQDGKVRALEVKKANGKVHTTSITKVCILPLDE